jgi:hypothetical protein
MFKFYLLFLLFRTVTVTVTSEQYPLPAA